MKNRQKNIFEYIFFCEILSIRKDAIIEMSGYSGDMYLNCIKAAVFDMIINGNMMVNTIKKSPYAFCGMKILIGKNCFGIDIFNFIPFSVCWQCINFFKRLCHNKWLIFDEK